MAKSMKVYNEVTFEITTYCPHKCKYCSSNTTSVLGDADWLMQGHIQKFLEGKRFKHIIISGGEPLAHPGFFGILQLCKKHSDDVIVYSNAITHLIYNQSVIDGVYLEANVTVLPEVDKIHILRRVKQGKEKGRPEIHLSRNFDRDCSCNHGILRPDGKLYKQPCNKFKAIKSVREEKK
jgi:organic radical activating enzyme